MKKRVSRTIQILFCLLALFFVAACGNDDRPSEAAVVEEDSQPIPTREPVTEYSADLVTLQTEASETLVVMTADALNQGSLGAQIAFQSLQGIVNRDRPRIFLATNDGERHDNDWLQLLADEYGVEATFEQDYLWYVDTFADEIDGYILFDSRKEESINVALSLAGLLRAVTVDERDGWLIEAIESAGIEQVLDVRDKDSDWLRQSEFWGQLGKNGIVLLAPQARLPNVRDFGVANQLAFFFNDTRRDRELKEMQEMVTDLEPGAAVYGWGYTDRSISEASFVRTATEAATASVPSDLAGNLSVYVHYPLLDSPQPPPPQYIPERTDVHYVSFVLSDGDNIQVILNKLAHPAHDLWASPLRGTVPIGWTIPPTLGELAPPILEWLYATATPNDNFVAGPGGWAYVYPSVAPNREALAARTQEALAATGIDTTVFLDYNREAPGFSKVTTDPFTAYEALSGIFFVAYDWSDPEAGTILWSNGKPVLPMLRIGYEDTAANELEKIAAQIRERPRDATSEAGYTVVYAHLWSTTVTDLVMLAESLGEGFEVVRPDVLVELATRHVRR